MSALSELLQEENRLRPMSLRARAERIEGRLSFATLGDYQRGSHAENPDEATLQGLADAYDIPLAKLQEAAAVPVGAGPWQPPAEVARLSRRQQQALTNLIMAMVDREGGSDVGTAKPGKKSPGGDGPASNVVEFPEPERAATQRAADDRHNEGQRLRDEQAGLGEESQDPERGGL